jgi:RNA recognition motif-containing protein
MLVKLFVGNLPHSVGDFELEQLFTPHGEVQSAVVTVDDDTRRSRGFGSVEIEVEDITLVIEAIDGREIDGRPLRVHEWGKDARSERCRWLQTRAQSLLGCQVGPHAVVGSSTRSASRILIPIG